MKPCLPALLLAATIAFSPALSLAETAPILAPDGRSSVRISDSDEILITDTATQQSRRLLSPKQDEDPKRQLSGFNNPAFSADGRSLYVLSTAWAVSDALHRIDLASGRTQFISAANDFQELHKGPHRGKLLLQKHSYRSQGGSSEVWYLGDPQGRILKRIGNDAEKAEFLRKQERQGK